MSSKNSFEGEINNTDDISGHILQTSMNEYCKNSLDVVFSNTAERILRIVGMQINVEKKWGEKINVERIVELYKAVFIKRAPITRKEYEYLQDFFSSKNVRAKGDKILSNIVLQQSDDNKEFTRKFLEDVQGKFTTEHFIAHIREELVRYPFVMDIYLADGEKIETFEEINWVGKIYSYVHIFGKHKLFLIKDDKKIVQLSEEFDQKPETLDNGLIFCGEIQLESDTDKIIDIKKAIRHSKNQGYFIQVWVIYRFNPETNRLEKIFSKEWIISIKELDQEHALFQTTNEDGKKGLIKIREGENFDVSQILQELYDTVYIWPDEIIVTEMKDEEMQEDGTSALYSIIWIHIVAWDDQNWSENKLCGKTLLGEVADYFESNIKDKLVKFYKNKNICSVWTTTWYNYYTIDKTQENIKPINWLQWKWKKYINRFREDFFEGVPTLVKEGNKAFVMVYDKETKSARNLIEIQGNCNFPNLRFFHETIELSLYWFWAVQYCFHEGKLYDAKEGFEVIDWNLYKKRWFWTSEDLWISIREDFGKISPYLEEIKTPIHIRY